MYILKYVVWYLVNYPKFTQFFFYILASYNLYTLCLRKCEWQFVEDDYNIATFFVYLYGNKLTGPNTGQVSHYFNTNIIILFRLTFICIKRLCRAWNRSYKHHVFFLIINVNLNVFTMYYVTVWCSPLSNNSRMQKNISTLQGKYIILL